MLVFCAALAVLVTARTLTPDASGRGTHVQLGLAPCGFLVLTGLPCPTCGLTTAFAYLAHGALLASLHAHPLGLPLFALTIAAMGLAIREGVRGSSLGEVGERQRVDRWALGGVLALLGCWVARLFAG